MEWKAPGAVSKGEHLYMESCDLLKHVYFLVHFIFIWSLETTHVGTNYDNSFSKFIGFYLPFFQEISGYFS